MALAIPKDSLVLVTGANGFIGSHVVDQFLEAGYRVRGTVRDISKVRNLSAQWEKKYGKGKYESVIVEDLSKDGAYDEAVKGVSAVAHVASVLTFDPDPEKVIPAVLAGMNSILISAAKEPSIKRFVATSSSTAATVPIPGKVFHIDSNLWNEADVKAAWAPGPIKPDRNWAVYGASKTESEKALWQFVRDKKPQFVVNTILPNANFGTILDPDQGASTGAWIRDLYKDGKKNETPPQWFVDVQDTARLHVAAIINPDVKDERIFAFAEPYNWNLILSILRKLRPDHKLPEDYQDEKDLSTVANERAIELLKRLGRPGWTPLEESIKHNIEGL